MAIASLFSGIIGIIGIIENLICWYVGMYRKGTGPRRFLAIVGAKRRGMDQSNMSWIQASLFSCIIIIG